MGPESTESGSPWHYGDRVSKVIWGKNHESEDALFPALFFARINSTLMNVSHDSLSFPLADYFIFIVKTKRPSMHKLLGYVYTRGRVLNYSLEPFISVQGF